MLVVHSKQCEYGYLLCSLYFIVIFKCIEMKKYLFLKTPYTLNSPWHFHLSLLESLLLPSWGGAQCVMALGSTAADQGSLTKNWAITQPL